MKEKEFYSQKGTYKRVPLSKKIKAENLVPIDIFEKFNSKAVSYTHLTLPTTLVV